MGRFDPVKNHLFLVETFSEVKRRIPDAKLLLVGRGPFEGSVRQAVEDAGLEGDVVFFGVTDRVPDVLKALDAFVFPSFSEGLPMSVMEAQAAGVPCVLSTGVPELAVAVPFAVERLPLEAGAGAWADAVERALSGFDIRDTAAWLESYYLDLAETQ